MTGPQLSSIIMLCLTNGEADSISLSDRLLGETYTAIGNLNQAVKAYREANKMAPDSYEGHKGLTSAYLQLGRLDEALEEAKTARDLAPEEEKLALDDLIAQLEAQRK